MSSLLVIRPHDREVAMDVLGSSVTVLVSGPERDLRVTLQSGNEGVGPPPHYHGWDESFFVTKGQVDFTSQGETSVCPAGTIVYVPAGTVHSFSYGPGGGEFIEVTGQTSKAVEMFSNLSRRIDSQKPDFEKVVQIFTEHGVTLHS